MALLDIVMTVLFNLLPIGLIWLPLLFLKRKVVAKKIYRRIAFGISFFFLIYFIFPMIFQFGADPDTLTNLGGVGIKAGFAYFVSRLFNLIANFAQIPLINFAFIFLLAPIISLLYLFVRLRKEGKEKFKKKLEQLSFEYGKSPKEMIIEKLEKGGFSEERRLFRALIVLLPITLYLLVTILKIAGIPDALSPTDGGLGWFIEIFFVYIATFLYAIQLIKASKASYEGKFIGEKLENDTYSSLMSVATPISILSILLFIIEAFQSSPGDIVGAINSLALVLYFFGYYIMAAFIFVSMVAIFEPIAILLLIKIIDGIKNRKKVEKQQKTITPSKKEVKNMPPNSVSALFGLVVALVVFILSLALALGVGRISGGENLWVNNLLSNSATSVTDAVNFEGLSAFLISVTIIMILVGGIFIGYSYQNNKNILVNSIIICSILLVMAIGFQLLESFGIISLFPFFGDSGTTYWVTGKLVSTDIFGPDLYTLRIALVQIELSDHLVLYILSALYQYTRYFMAFFLIGLSFHYVRQNFVTKTVKRDKFVDQITFAQIKYIPSTEEAQQSNYLLSIPKTYRPSENERDEVKRLMYECRNGITVNELLPDDLEERKRLFVTLSYMTRSKKILWWEPEFSFTNERAELDSMYTMYEDGRDVFSYKFKESSTADPGLVAGMFSAITSFIKETTKSADLLRTIDHGDTKVIIEYGQYVFGAIFADRETTEIRSKLASFVLEFEKRHGDVLKKWDGNCAPFVNDEVLLKEIFEI